MRAVRRELFLLCLCAILSSLITNALAQGAATAYPNRPMRLVLPFTTGGMVDTVTRALAQYISERLGQPIVVDNRTGASGAIALDTVAKSAPDGHTLLVGSSTNFVFLPGARKALPYDTVRDLASVTMISTAPFYLVVTPSVDARTVQELIALARSQPGKLNFASLGFGGANHLAMEMFKSRAKVDLHHVPYKGSAQAMADLLGGQVQAMFEGPTSTLPQIRAGKLRVLGSSVPQRAKAMPDVPTIAESGVPGFDISTWNGLSVPAGVPQPIINRLNSVAGEMLRDPAMIQKFAASNIDLIASTPEEMDERIRREIPIFTKVMRDAGIDPE